jgi:uncharacterized protein YndB with AHSA1/START domain
MAAANKVAAAKYTTQFTMPSDVEIMSTRVVDAPRRLVWEAWTKPEHVQQWLLGPEGWTMPVCEMDLRPGGAWRFVWRRANGNELAMSGIFKEITPPERLVQTERWGPEWPETINTLVLTEQGDRTTITQRILYPSKEARDAAFQTGMQDGMVQTFNRLDEYLRRMR